MSNHSEVLLSLQGISKIYPVGDTKFYALNHVDLTLYRGEFLIVLGPSGSGKSTLLNIIGGTDRPSEGSILFKGEDLAKTSDRKLTNYRRNEIGFVFQFYNLLPTLTALENVQVATEIAEHPLDPLTVLDLVGIKLLANHFPSQMSGGEQQRVAIARALASNPSMLLCDEPTGALDSKTSDKVLNLLLDLCHQLNKNVVFITHNEEIAKIGHRIIHLKDGMIESIEER